MTARNSTISRNKKKSYTTIYRLSTKFNDLRLISNFLSTFAAVAEQKAIVKIFERIPRGSRIYLHISRISMTQICWFRGLPLRIIEEMLLLINCGWLRRRTKAPRKHILVLTIKGTFTYDRQRWKIPPALCDLGHAIRLSLCHVNVCFAGFATCASDGNSHTRLHEYVNLFRVRMLIRISRCFLTLDPSELRR